MQRWLRAIQLDDRDWDRKLRPEFLRLNEAARASERLARYARRKTEIVFDPGRSPGLTPERSRVQHEDRQPLGGRVDRGRQVPLARRR